MKTDNLDLHFMTAREEVFCSRACRSGVGRARVAVLLAGVLLIPAGAFLQTPPRVTSQTAVHSTEPTWVTLKSAQQAALLPLSNSWDALSEGQKRKWLAIAKTYPDLGPLEQAKMHSRMVEWAALSPKDRELARLNFAQSKSVNNSSRTADWEAYQALSPEERQKLANGTKVKPVGAAVAVKPVAPEKLAAVPVTRHTPEQERASVVSKYPLNRSTLLPQVPVNTAEPSSVPVTVKP